MRHVASVRTLGVHAVAGAMLFIAGCAAIAGVSDYSVDPCFGGCSDATSGADAPVTEGAPPIDAPTDADAGVVDAPLDTAPPPSPGQSVVTVAGTGVAVGKAAVVTLTAKDDAGTAIPRTGAKVTFTATGGTSVVSFGTIEDRGDGTYRVLATGVTQGTKLNISAVLDGAPLTTTPAPLRVVNPPSDGLTFSLDAANADRAGNFGGKGCGGAGGLTSWTDLGASSFTGVLAGFDDPCAPTSGWQGTGAPENPFRLAFDGVADNVAFGAVNALQKYTVLAWIRKTGDGFAGVTSPANGGGLVGPTRVVPIVTKGTAEADTDALDIDYFIGIVAGGQLGSDYESTPGHANQGLIGATVLANDTWYMVGTTLDASVNERVLWLDGVSDASSTPTLPPSGAASSVLTVGGAKRSTDAPNAAACTGAQGTNGCGRFQGDVAAVLTYDHALTASEMADTCQSFSSRFGMMGCPP